MMQAIPPFRPVGAAVSTICQAVMKTILHLGAHRTGTTSFQTYLRDNAQELLDNGVGFWGPRRTRRGLFAGILSGQGTRDSGAHMARVQGRLAMQREQAMRRGVTHLIVSDENMLGAMRRNMSTATLYPAAGDRLARFFAAFGGKVDEVILTIRSPELHWASVAAHGVDRGLPVPGQARWARIARARRGWREVVQDVACAMPGARLRVFPFERFAGRPQAMVRAVAPQVPRLTRPARWMNRAPLARDLRALARDRGDARADLVIGNDTRWMPFDAVQQTALRERYADDVMWLAAGADGLAQLEETRNRHKTGLSLQAGLALDVDRGHPRDGIKERHMARPC